MAAPITSGAYKEVVWGHHCFYDNLCLKPFILRENTNVLGSNGTVKAPPPSQMTRGSKMEASLLYV